MNFSKVDEYVDFQIELAKYNVRNFIYWKLIFSMLRYPEDYKEEYSWNLDKN